MIFWYNLMLWLATPLWAGYTLWRVVRGSWRERVAERFGLLPIRPNPSRRRIWVHAVSVGEVLAALPVLKRLRERFPKDEIVLTTTTPTGQKTAHDLASTHVDSILYFPLDLPFAVRNALNRIHPQTLIVMESELWLNLLREQKRRGGAVLILNGRVSDRSFRRARRLKKYYRAVLNFVDFACVQSATDAVRFVELGLTPSRVAVVGNTKFDQALEATDTDPVEWRKRLYLPLDAPVIVVGSTRTPDEEQLVLTAYQMVRQQMPATCLVIAPRHLERVPELEAAMRVMGLCPQKRTSLSSGLAHPKADTDDCTVQVVILDTFGELARLYAAATVCVIGGGFAPLGGQNLFQPLAHGKPVFFGPHMHNFRDIAALALEEGIGFEVANAESLAAGILRLLIQPEQIEEIGESARALIARHQGASGRCIEKVAQWTETTLPFGRKNRYH